MNWNNNLEKLVKETLNVSRPILPNEEILQRAGINYARYRALLNNQVKMTAWEAVVLSDWLGTDIRQMVSEVQCNQLEESIKAN